MFHKGNVSCLVKFATSKCHLYTYFQIFVKNQTRCLKNLGNKYGTVNHVKEVDNCYAKVGYILASGNLGCNASTQVLKDLYSKAVSAYNTVSVHMPHYRKHA